MVGNGTRRRSRAVDTGQDTNVVASGDAAVGALDAHERRFTPRRLRLDVGAKGVVSLEVALVRAHVQVMRVNVLASGDRLACKADDLVVAPHRLARCERM